MQKGDGYKPGQYTPVVAPMSPYPGPGQSTPASEIPGILSLDTNDSSIKKRVDYPGPVAKDGTDPVRDGELVVQQVDVDLPSAGLPFRFERTYRSRVSHWGVLGYGWDFNYNRRLVAVNGCGDLDLMTGDNGRVRFSPSGAVSYYDHDTTVLDYAPQAGIALRLRGFFAKNGDPNGKRWELTDASGVVYQFDSNGLLIKIVDTAGNYLSIAWEQACTATHLCVDGGIPLPPPPPAWTIAPGAQQPPTDPRFGGLRQADLLWRIHSITDSTAPSRIIYFVYSTSKFFPFFLHCLSFSESADCKDALVTYSVRIDDGKSYPDSWNSAGNGFGDLVAAQTANGVDQAYAYYDDDHQPETSSFLTDEDADNFCSSACAPPTDCSALALCTGAPPSCVNALSNHPEFDYHRLCVDSVMDRYGCNRQLERVVYPNVNLPYCEYTSPQCQDNCQNEIKPGFWQTAGVYQPVDIPTYCNDHCYAEQVCAGASTPRTVCEALTRSSVPFCGGGSCYQDCRARYQPTDSTGRPLHAYGRMDDLIHNLVSVTQLGRQVQRNTYGTNPFDPAFDKVTSQQLGDDVYSDQGQNVIAFYYPEIPNIRLVVTPPLSLPGLLTRVAGIPTSARTIAHVVGSAIAHINRPAPVEAIGENVERIKKTIFWSPEQFVDSLATFQSVEVCPSKCIEQRTLPRPVGHIPLPAGFLSNVFTGAAAQTTSSTRLRAAAHVTSAGDGTVTIEATDNAHVSSVLRSKTEFGSVTLTALDSSGRYEVHGSPAATEAFLNRATNGDFTLERGVVLGSHLPPGSVKPQPPRPVPPPSVGGQCARWQFYPARVSAAAIAAQFPTNAVVIRDLHGVTRTQYYDAQGRLVREVNHHLADHEARQTTDYNYDDATGAVQGIQYPGGRRVCQEFDKNGNPAELAELPGPNSEVDSPPRETLYTFDGGLVTDIKLDPNGDIPALTHYGRDAGGRITSTWLQVDAAHSASIRYDYDSLPAKYPQTITQPNGTVTRLDFSRPRFPWGPTLGRGHVRDFELPTGPTTVTYDADGPEPLKLSISYDGVGHAKDTFRVGHHYLSHIDLDELGRIGEQGFEAPDGTKVYTKYVYDTSVLPTQAVSPTSTTTYGRDSLGHLQWTAEVGSDGTKRATCWNYSADGRLEAVVRPEGNLIAYSYDDENRVRQVEQGYPGFTIGWVQACIDQLHQRNLPIPATPKEPADLQLMMNIEYDSAGFVRSVRDASGVTMQFVVDGFGRVIERIDDDGNHARRGYDARGRVAWEAVYGPNAPAYAKPTAPDGNLQSMVEYQYDNLDRITRTDRWYFVGSQWVRPGQPYVTTIVSYDDANGRVSTSVDGHPPTVVQFDGLGRVTKTTYPNGNVATSSHIDNGDAGEKVVWTATGPDGATRTGTNYYDDYGRLIEADDDQGTALQKNGYDHFGQLTTRQIGRQVARLGYDSFFRPSSVVEGSGANPRSVTFYWDGNDRLSSVIDSNEAMTNYFYNGLDLLSHAQHPGNGISTRDYVPGSTRPWHDTDEWGHSHTYGYDPAGRLQTDTAQTALASGQLERVFSYTALGQIETAQINQLGGVVGVTNPLNGLTVTLSYDSLGNRVSEDEGLAPFVVQNTWDPNGGAAQTTLALRGGAASRSPFITRHFDDNGRLGDISINNRLVATFKHEADGGKIVYGSGTVVAKPVFDHRGRNVGTDVLIGGVTAAYAHDAVDVDGVVRERQRLLGGQTSTDFYVLDDAGRVIGENNGIAGQPQLAIPTGDLTDTQVSPFVDDSATRGNTFHQYSVDGLANWLSTTDASGFHQSSFTTAQGLNQYNIAPDEQQWLYQNGAVSNIGADSYQYDQFGQLVQATVNGQTMTYGYDALGRRVLEQNLTAGTSTNLVWDGREPIAMGSGTAFATYTVRLGGDGLDEQVALAGLARLGVTYLHAGPDYSVFAATNEAGVEEAYSYSAFGRTAFFNAQGAAESSSVIGNRFLYQGQLFDPALNAYSMRAREYLPDAGRFLSPDPMGIGGGENLYGFVLGKPLALRDPFGLSGIDFNIGSNSVLGFRLSTVELQEVGPGLFEQAYAQKVHILFDSRYSGWTRAGAALDAGVLLLPAGAEQLGRGIANTPHYVAGGLMTVYNTVADWDPNPSTGDKVMAVAQAAGGAGQTILGMAGAGGLAEGLMSRMAEAVPAARLQSVAPAVDEAAPITDPSRLLTAGSYRPYAGGVIRSFVQPTDQIYYRVFSENPQGSFLTAVPPPSSEFAREALALPPGNQATFIQEVLVPAGTRLERSRALPQFGRSGGAEQFQLLDRIPTQNFGPGEALQ